MNRKSMFMPLTFGLGLTVALMWLLSLSGIGLLVARAASYTVCPAGPPTCDYSIIQDAVDAASDGEVIKIAAGTYDDINNYSDLAQVVYIVKSVTLRGGYTTAFTEPPDPEANPTTLDAGGLGRVIYIEGNITPTIEGLRITGGDANILEPLLGYPVSGGGVQIYGAAATIRNNRIFNNTAYNGGGLRLDGSAATLEDNTIISNISDESGGGLFFSDCGQSTNVTIDNNTISQNTADWAGGLEISNCTGTLSRNLITSNTSGRNGGGLVLQDSDMLVIGNTFSEISATDGAGGVFLWGTDATLSGNLVSENVAGWAAGIQIGFGEITLINNIFVDNNADSANHSGVHLGDATVYMLHNTIARNPGAGSNGIYVDNGTVYLTNTIIVGHTIGIDVKPGGTAILENTLWGTGIWANDFDTGGSGTINASGDLWGDPDFMDYEAGDYHIGAASDAIDAGVDAGVNIDFDHQPRPYLAPDIGADEYWPPGALKFIYLPLVMR